VKNVERIPDIGPYIVACMDDELLQLCKAKGIPAFYANSAHIIGDRGNLGTANGQKQQTIGADRCVSSLSFPSSKGCWVSGRANTPC
jgi:hypothetical protein